MPSAIKRTTAQIPVIDISSSNDQAAGQLLAAAASFGFVFVKNNDAGIPPEDIETMFNLSQQFFKSPVSVKEECSINSNKSGKNRGWLSMHTETLDPGKQKRGDFKEAFNIGEYENNAPAQPLSGPLAAHPDTIGAFADACHALCNRVLQLFAIGLNLGADWFTSRHDRCKGPSGSILRLLYYPSIGETSTPDADDIRAGAHSDYGSVTLLFQLPGQPGLEILTPEGEWAAVPVDPSGTLSDGRNGARSTALPILVNIGDLLSYWTNNLLKSTVHRVIFPREGRQGGEDRYSIAYFCHPLDDAELVPVPSKTVQEYSDDRGSKGTARGKDTITAKDHLNARLAATYGIKSS